MTAIKAALYTVCLAAFLVAGAGRGNAQVPVEWLPRRSAAGSYTHPAAVKVRTVTSSATGLLLECSESIPSARRPFLWREKYAMRRGKLVLIGVFRPQLVAGPPPSITWRDTHQIRELPPVKARRPATASLSRRIEIGPPPTPPIPPTSPAAEPVDRGQPARPDLGPISLNPRWTNYRAYLKRLADTAQIEWDRILAVEQIRPEASGRVSVRFVLDSTGALRITGVEPEPGISEDAVRACLRALTVRTPYDAWTEDMIADLGARQEMSFSFYYY